jgi:hypothetical protein
VFQVVVTVPGDSSFETGTGRPLRGVQMPQWQPR